MRRRFSVFALVCSAGFAASGFAHADTIIDFSLVATQFTISGDFGVDTAALNAGLASSSLVGLRLTTETLLFDGVEAYSGPGYGSSRLRVDDSGAFFLTLDAPSGSVYLVNPSPCLTVGCTIDGVYDNVPTIATYSPVPEPSALLLLGTGALGVCGAARRRVAV